MIKREPRRCAWPPKRQNLHEFFFLSTIRWVTLIPIVFLTLVIFILGAFRYYLIVKEMKASVPFVDVFRHLMIARFLNKLLPQSGIIYRAHAFKKENDMSYGSFLASFIAFVWLELVLTILVATIIVAVYQPGLSANNIPMLPLLLVFSFFLLAITFLSRILPVDAENSGEAVSTLGYSKRLFFRLISQIGCFFELARTPRLLLTGGLIIIINTALSVLKMFFLFQLIGVTAKISELSLFVATNTTLNMLVLTPGNLGIIEGLFGFLSGAIGIGAAQGVTVALILRAVTFLILAVLSGLLLFLKNIKISSSMLKKIDEKSRAK